MRALFAFLAVVLGVAIGLAVSSVLGTLDHASAAGVSPRTALRPVILNVNAPPDAPIIREPGTEEQVVHPADVHMATSAFSDSDPKSTHRCTDWEIRTRPGNELVWQSACNTDELVHVHMGDGTFMNSRAKFSELVYDSPYKLRVRHRDNSNESATEWSEWSERNFKTSPAPPAGTAVAWTARQPGFQIETFAGGLQLPVNIAMVPNPGLKPTDPFMYVTELYGTIKVVSRDGTVSDYATGVLNYGPSGSFPGSGEQGLTGIVVEPKTGDIFVSTLYSAPGGPYPMVVRFHSSHGGVVSDSHVTILDMVGETQGASHQISNISIGPDGKLYVHMGDGFNFATAQNLDSFRGKILRLNLDGSAPTDNPFYEASNGIGARDYVYAYGLRNPFGGDWRAEDGLHYSVENGPAVDRFAQVIEGRNFGWNDTNKSMTIFAIYNWFAAVAPVNIVFVEPTRFGGSGFPAAKQGNAYVSESGPTYATGPQVHGKQISEFVLDEDGNRVSGPTKLVEYTGTGKATASALAAGAAGLYFSDLYKDLDAKSPIDPGANILLIRYADNDNDGIADANDPDDDNDGWTDIDELAIKENPLLYCAIMRADVGNDGNVSILDIAAAATVFGQTIPPASPRLNQDTDATISILDIAAIATQFGKSVAACP